MSQLPPPYLVIIRHSLTEMEADVPPASWVLSATGRRRCQGLARELRPYQLQRLFTSHEAKAQQTASLVAQELELPIMIAGGLHEQERPSVPTSTTEEFRAGIKALFSQPDELVFGDETASAAALRFSLALNWILDGHPGQSLGVVTHGTVMTLWLARICGPKIDGLAPFQFWGRLGLPAFVVLSRQDLEVVEVVYEITAGE